MRYVIGLDGGGSKLSCVLADETGKLIGASAGGPTNSSYNSLEEIDRSISSAISEVLSAHAIDAIDVAVMNSAMPADYKMALSYMKKNLHPNTAVHLRREFDLSLYGAIQEEFGALVQAGTGSFATIKTALADKTVDAWGSLAGDEGSGFDIGRQALVACARMIDGRAAPTLLLEKTLAHFKQPNMWPLMYFLYSQPASMQRTLIAGLCPIVGGCVAEGDQAAIAIIENAASELALKAITVLRRPGVEDGFPLTVAGGVWKTSPLLYGSFAAQVQRHFPRIPIVPPLFEPVIGGVLLGLKEIGYPVKERLPELKRQFAAFAMPSLLFGLED